MASPVWSQTSTAAPALCPGEQDGGGRPRARTSPRLQAAVPRPPLHQLCSHAYCSACGHSEGQKPHAPATRRHRALWGRVFRAKKIEQACS